MSKHLTVFIAACIVMSQGCTRKNEGTFTLPADSKANLKITEIEADSIPLESVTTSFVIESDLQDSTISIIDKLFCTLYRFNLNGSLKEKKLGQGHAKNETAIGRIATHAFMGSGNLFLFDFNGGHHIYDKNILMKDYFKVVYEFSGDGSLDKDKLYDTPSEYTQLYNDIVCRSYKNNVYFNVHMAYPMCNYVTNTQQHLKRNANILEMRLDEQQFGRLLAIGYPESYQKNSLNKAILSSVNFDISQEGEFYVTYEADTLIYEYDSNYRQQKCFGYAGRDMSLNYITINTTEDSRKYWRSERLSKGYYNWLEYVDETGLLFRSYQKGSGQATDGLQIYKDGVLIGDVDVPKGLKAMGYSDPYYYSRVITDEELEIMYLYRFKL